MKLHVPSTSDWKVHVVLPWARQQDVPEALDCAISETLEDGTVMLCEWTADTIAQIERVLSELKVKEVVWHKLTMPTLDEVLDRIPRDDPEVVVFNCADGIETEGWPGLSVIKGLEKRGVAFTGASTAFFEMDTCKTAMKVQMTAMDAPTPKYYDLTHVPQNEEEVAAIKAKLAKMRMPVIIKPVYSASSRGITKKSVVWNAEEAYESCDSIREEFGGVYVEEFISGREFTVLISGSSRTGIKTYAPVERMFNPNLKEHERYLSYELKWSEWGLDEQSGGNWWNNIPPKEEQISINNAVQETFEKVCGNGYARMDVRMDKDGGIFVLDVNANCSIDYAPDSAMGQILRASGVSFNEFIHDLLTFGFQRKQFGKEEEQSEEEEEVQEATPLKKAQLVDSRFDQMDAISDITNRVQDMSA